MVKHFLYFKQYSFVVVVVVSSLKITLYFTFFFTKYCFKFRYFLIAKIPPKCRIPLFPPTKLQCFLKLSPRMYTMNLAHCLMVEWLLLILCKQVLSKFDQLISWVCLLASIFLGLIHVETSPVAPALNPTFLYNQKNCFKST